jgi:hypothetical protein
VPKVIVVDREVPVSWREIYAAMLPKHTEVEFYDPVRSPFNPGPQAGVGVLSHTWWCNGAIVAEVRVDGKLKGIFLNEKKSRLRRIKPKSNDLKLPAYHV